ncbi:hypothetical protein HDU96_007733 [Phlyctochytrium bullatum]|nr:hypothetical protein HDU96_007733 [Phlyctochytrium bullatum]
MLTSAAQQAASRNLLAASIKPAVAAAGLRTLVSVAASAAAEPLRPRQAATASLRTVNLQQHRTLATAAPDAAAATIPAPSKTYRVLIIGAGSAGLAVASQLAKHPEFAGSSQNKLAIVDPSDVHHYQPLWTFVGGGLKTLSESGRPLSTLIPKKADWVKSRVAKILPSKNLVLTTDGKAYGYEYLVVAPGIQINWDNIPGLREALEKREGVSSNYSESYVENTAEFIRNFQGGNALFTQPATPVKCAGAPQKIMYLAEEQFRARNVRAKTKVAFHTGMGKIFSVDKYGAELTNICKQRDIEVNLLSNLVSVDGANRKATFKKGADSVTLDYDFMHVTPPMGPPAFLKQSEDLANADGWVNVDKVTTRHVKYANVFSCGDASSLPTSKTAAAAAAQSGVLVWNLAAALEGKADGGAEYNGYTSCPLVTGKGKLILAEFDYNLAPRETFFINQGKENPLFYYLTSDVIPSIRMHLPRLPQELWLPILSRLDNLPAAIELEWLLHQAQTYPPNHRGAFAYHIDMYDGWSSSSVAEAYTVPHLSISAHDTGSWTIGTAAWMLRFRPCDAHTFAFGNLAARRGWVEVLERMLERSGLGRMDSKGVLMLPKFTGGTGGVEMLGRLPRFSPETLRIAAEAGHLEVVKFLVERCHIFVSEKVYQAAIKAGSLEVAQYVLPSEYEPSVIDLIHAAEAGSIPMFSYVLERATSAHEQEVINAIRAGVRKRENGEEFANWCMALPQVAQFKNRKATTDTLLKKGELAEALANGGHVKLLAEFLASEPLIFDSHFTTNWRVAPHLIFSAWQGSRGSSLDDFESLLQVYSQSRDDALGFYEIFSHGGLEGVTAEFLELLKKHFKFETKFNSELVSELLRSKGTKGRKEILESLAGPEWEMQRKEILNDHYAFHVAVEDGDLDYVKLFLANNARRIDLPISRALKANHIEVLLYFVKYCQRYPEKVVESNFIAPYFLRESTNERRLDAVTALLKAFPDVYCKEALEISVSEGYWEIARLLADSNNVEACKAVPDHAQLKCLLNAAMRGDSDGIITVLTASNFIPPDLARAATTALSNGNLDVAILLMNAHNNNLGEVRKPYRASVECLIDAARSGHGHIVRFLLGIEGFSHDGRRHTTLLKDGVSVASAIPPVVRYMSKPEQLDSFSSLVEFGESFRIIDFLPFLHRTHFFIDMVWYVHRTLEDNVNQQMNGRRGMTGD